MNRPQLTINVTDFLTWLNKHVTPIDAKFVGTVIRFASGRTKSVELVISRDNLRILYKITQEFKKDNHNTIGFLFGLVLFTLQRYFDKDLNHVIRDSQYNMGSTSCSVWCKETMTSALKKFQIVMDIVSSPKKYVKCRTLAKQGHELDYWMTDIKGIVEGNLYLVLNKSVVDGNIKVKTFDRDINLLWGWNLPLANFVPVGA